MMDLVFALVALSAIALIGSGLYYQIFRKKTESDPVLIAGCYLFGGVFLASFLVS